MQIVTLIMNLIGLNFKFIEIPENKVEWREKSITMVVWNVLNM